MPGQMHTHSRSRVHNTTPSMAACPNVPQCLTLDDHLWCPDEAPYRNSVHQSTSARGLFKTLASSWHSWIVSSVEGRRAGAVWLRDDPSEPDDPGDGPRLASACLHMEIGEIPAAWSLF